MSIVPKTKAQAVALATTFAALGALVLMIAQAWALAHCPVAP